MHRERLSACLSIVFTVTQLVGPAAIWALEPEFGIRVEPDRGLIVAGLRGQAHTASANHPHEKRALQFGQSLGYGDQLLTGPQSRAEVLIGHQALLTLEEDSSIGFTTTTTGTTLVEMHDGAVRLAVAASQLAPDESVTVRTATTTVVTQDGVFQVRMTPGEAPAIAQRTEGKGQMVRVAYPPSTLLARDETPSVTYQVTAGTVTVTGKGQSVPVTAGQSVQVLAGQIGAPFATPAGEASTAPLTALAQHRDTPKSGVAHLVAQEMRQAEVLGLLLTDAGAEKSELEKQEESEQGVILALTGVSLPGGQGSGLPTFPGLPPPGGPSEVGGPSGAVLDPSTNGLFNIGISDTPFQFPPLPGGGGLLLFHDSNLTLDGQKDNGNTGFGIHLTGPSIPGNDPFGIRYTPVNTELLMVDGGVLANAPHMGQPPTERLTVGGLQGIDASSPPFSQTFGQLTGDPGRNTILPIPEDGGPDAPGSAESSPVNVFTRVTDSNSQNMEAINTVVTILEQFASNPAVTPGTADQSTLFLGLPGFSYFEGVNGVIRARSASGGQLVKLSGGVVLSNTSLTATATEATSAYFPDLDGSVTAILGRNFDLTLQETIPDNGGIPDTITVGGGGLNPAHVVLKDRILGVVGGGTIFPESVTNPTISLLTLLDSTLTGPTAPPTLISGDSQPVAEVGEAPIPLGKSRADIPPLIEVIGSTGNPSSTNSAYAINIRADMALSILEASAPLVSVIQGSMATSQDFIHVEGNAAQLMANVPNDQLVLRAAIQLNKATLNVGGHLTSFTDGATGAITGNLVSLANGSTLNLGGALVNVGNGASFSLSNGSLVAFGNGVNAVNISAISGTCSGCMLSSAIPNLEGIPVLKHQTANITVGPGFVPYAGVGSFAGGTTNTVTVTPGAAVLQVGANGTLTLNP